MKRVIKLIAGAYVALLLGMGTQAQNSVLSSGEWAKLAVQQTGIHQITYENLVSYGIDPAQINPKHIRIYGNGNGMLPENNEAFRYDDLQENAIFVYGEDDTSFDPGDYVLFYGEGPTEWDLNAETGKFEHKVNLYSDFTYYFFTSDLGEGKRIEDQILSTAAPTYISSSFNAYYFHELELENLIHSGKDWYGERFEETLTYDFEVGFPHLITTSPIFFKTSVAGRSQETSNLSFEINGETILSIDIPLVNFQYYSDFAKKRWDTASFYSNSPTLNLTITYNKPTDSSSAWLDYFVYNAKRDNIFGGGQMLFRDMGSVGPGNITEFQIQTTNSNLNVWDVTNPLIPTHVALNIAGGTAGFKLETDSLLEFIAFDQSQFFTPYYAGQVENQNLHAIVPPDLIIITHPDFKAEAEQLAYFRENFDGLSTLVVSPDKIYNEFSSGARDITAIRDFLKFLHLKSNGEKPQYLLLFGDASYAYKNTTDSAYNFVPVWESLESLNLVSSYCSDDFFSDSDEFYLTAPSIGTGRLPAKSLTEANAIVEKIIDYSSNEAAYGSWRNEVVSIADDADGNLHLDDAEELAELIDTTDRSFNISKIYLDAYAQDTLPNGSQVIPGVNQAITDKINTGVNIINYIGHGSYSGLSHEMTLSADDLGNWENDNYYPFMFVATCEFGQFDDPEKYSLAEQEVLMEGRGMSAILSTTRATYAGANSAFQKKFFSIALHHPGYTLGKIIKLAKQQSGSIQNHRKFCLFGDPAMRLCYPFNKVVTEAINGVAVTYPLDTLNPGEQIIASGYLSDSVGNKIYDFNGTMDVKIFERAKTDSTLGNDPNSIVTGFLVQDSVLLQLQTSIVNGQFAFNFDLPHEMDEGFGTIKLSYYAKDGYRDANGYFSDIVVGGQPNSINEHGQADDFISVFPTLFSDRLNYRSKKDIHNLSIEIIDLSGHLLFSGNRAKVMQGVQYPIDVSDFRKGMYIFKARSTKEIMSLKLIKQ